MIASTCTYLQCRGERAMTELGPEQDEARGRSRGARAPRRTRCAMNMVSGYDRPSQADEPWPRAPCCRRCRCRRRADDGQAVSQTDTDDAHETSHLVASLWPSGLLVPRFVFDPQAGRWPAIVPSSARCVDGAADVDGGQDREDVRLDEGHEDLERVHDDLHEEQRQARRRRSADGDRQSPLLSADDARTRRRCRG